MCASTYELFKPLFMRAIHLSVRCSTLRACEQIDLKIECSVLFEIYRLCYLPCYAYYVFEYVTQMCVKISDCHVARSGRITLEFKWLCDTNWYKKAIVSYCDTTNSFETMIMLLIKLWYFIFYL
jgi:hypothetical protein